MVKFEVDASKHHLFFSTRDGKKDRTASLFGETVKV
jgi:hypothetical protein